MKQRTVARLAWSLGVVAIAAILGGMVLQLIRRQENALGWLFLVAGLGLGLANSGSAYAVYGLLIEPGPSRRRDEA